MEPLSRDERDAMKGNGRGVTEADIDEYEELLVQRHWSGGQEAEASLREGERSRDQRIETLYRKLYGKEPETSSSS